MIANSKLSGNLSNRITGCFRRQGGRTRYTWIDFNSDDIFFLIGRYGKLYVATTCKITYAAHHLDSHIAHTLESAIGKGHRRSYRDRVARMDTHRIHVFYGTDNSYIVIPIAQEFQFVFLPAQKCLINKHLMDRGRFQTAIKEHIKVLFLIDDRGTRTAQGKGRTYYERKTKALGNFFPFEEGHRCFRRSHWDTYLVK